MPDSNWLYSSVAQSAAAIVAIIGGFITSRILMLSAEKGRLTEEIVLKEKRAKEINEQLQSYILEWKFMIIDDFLDECLDDLVEDSSVKIEELLRRHPYWKTREDLDLEVLKNKYKEISAELIEIKSFFEKCVAGKILSADSPRDVDDFLTSCSIEPPKTSYNILRKKYKKTLKKLREKREEERIAEERRTREERVRALSPLYGGMAGIIPSLSIKSLGFRDIDMLDLEPSISLSGRMSEIQEKNLLKERIQNTTAAENLLKVEINGLQEKLAAFKYPAGVYSGIWILAYLAIVGVIIPLCFMPAQQYSFPRKVVVISLFGSGILGVFWYIIRQLRILTKE